MFLSLVFLYTGRSNKNCTPKRALIFRISFKQKQNWLLHVKEQSISSVWANFFLFLIYRYILQYSWNYLNLTKHNMLQWRKLFAHTMPFKLLKFIKPSVWPQQVDSAVYEGSAADFQSKRSQRQSAHLLGESWPTDHRQIYWSLTWQTKGCGSTERWTHWTVIIDHLVHLLSCSVT